MEDFKDNFSKQAAVYQSYRPTYPTELFSFLASLTPTHDLAWDCATGNGQAAMGLAPYYRQIYATDPSAQQIAHAQPHERVVYHVERAEQTALGDHSADIVTVAQALHWFNFDAFYAEVRRVLKPGGAIAVWTYGLPSLTPEIDRCVKHFHDHTVGRFWQRENRLVEQEYATVPFPFHNIPAPDLHMEKPLSLQGLTGLLRSWSAVQRFIDAHGTDPVNGISDELANLWGKTSAPKTATWKLTLKAGRP